MKGDMREGYAGSAKMLADCAKIVSNTWKVSDEFSAKDVSERLKVKVSTWAVTNKLKRIKGVEVIPDTHPVRFRKTMEVWY